MSRPRRLAAVIAAVVTLAVAALVSCGSRPVAPAPRAGPSYLSLGDSLARGVEPGPAGRDADTRHGYPDQLYALLRRHDPGLRLVRLGCPGETTATMISGRHCPYAAGSQLAAAVAFLHAHRGHVTLITLDIGANDPGSCFTLPVRAAAPPCAAVPDSATAARLTRILASLRAAAPATTLIGMTYYAPELPEWRDGPAGQAAARRGTQRTLAFDALLSRVYATAGARVADVAGAFATADFADPAPVPGLGLLPRNVADVCAWTRACALPPRRPDKHPDTAGYAIIARAFLATATPAHP